jgi:ATP-dependent DNA helicase DinG
MLQPHDAKIVTFACLFAHCCAAQDGGNRVYEVAASLLSPDRPEETFSSYVRHGRTTERDRHASGVSRDLLRTAPSLGDVTAFLLPLLGRTGVVLTLTGREALEPLLGACGHPRLIDLRFAAEFFLPQADSSGLKALWEHLHGKPRGKFSFTAAEAVGLSLDLVRHIAGSVLNPADFPPAPALRFYLERSGTLFGRFFCHVNRQFRDYFGGLLDPAQGSDTPHWKGFLEKAAPAPPAPAGEPPREEDRTPIPLARIPDLYQGLAAAARYARRPSQADYAGQVAAALNDRAVLTIEAGTGTGKTQGYLLPVLEFLRLNPAARVAVSTYTKSLQEQIIRREIPLSLSLHPDYGRIPTALLKGKSNYICAEKLDRIGDESLSGSRLLAWLAIVIRAFLFRRADGDAVGERIRFHLNDGLFFRRLIREVSARSGCSPRHRHCPAQVIAAEARRARLIVTNHHKLALLDRDETLGGLFRNCVIDEANHFEGAVRGAFGIEISSRELSDAIAYLESVLRRLAPGPQENERGPAAIAAAVQSFRDGRDGFAAALASLRGSAVPGEAAMLPAEHPAWLSGSLSDHLDSLRGRLRAIGRECAFVRSPEACRRLGIRPRTADRLKIALQDLREGEETLKTLAQQVRSPGHVLSGILYQRHWVVTLRTVEVADLLRTHLYEGHDAVIFTSATLRQGGSFEGFRQVAGMPAVEAGRPAPDPAATAAVGEAPPGPSRPFRFASVPSPFDPEALEICVPPEAVSGAFGAKEAWLTRVADLLPGLIRSNRGRTLVLFASYGDLEAVAAQVADRIQADGFPLLIQQNGAPTARLCDEFRAIRESVLFGVDTFWYGVDFPGDTLTQVVITRLPYPHPQDPLQAARRNLLSSREYWSRYRYETAIKLRQGMGRLIRSEADRGRVVILDSRYRSLARGGAA